MTGNDAGLNDFVEQEESSFMDSPKRRSTEWTDEKHNLYLKSMEASFVDQLYNSLDMRKWQIENECSSDSMSSRNLQGNNICPSGQFKVIQHGFWSRIDFRRENLVHEEANRPNVSSNNPWIQHFKNRNKQGPTESLEKPPFTTCSNTEVIDQNFVEDDSGVQMMNKAYSKKRKGTYADPELVLMQEEEGYGSGWSVSGARPGQSTASSFGHFSCNRNH
ncbi:hypothetical protein SSX86_001879 [Deinandra increscens subsp. villosa]|uniref:Uncharacterized protein n=1 Tax=Deinandra increscens subsp. villosa TaxID=3103831 RepID=A0AAP0HB79_9ASTR